MLGIQPFFLTIPTIRSGFLLHLVASTVKCHKLLKPLILRNILRLQALAQNPESEFKSHRPDHIHNTLLMNVLKPQRPFATLSYNSFLLQLRGNPATFDRD
jgi:hypothetical protein